MQVSYADRINNPVASTMFMMRLKRQDTERHSTELQSVKPAMSFNNCLNGLKHWLDAHPDTLPGERDLDDNVTKMYIQWVNDTLDGKYNYSEENLARLQELLDSVHMARVGKNFTKRLTSLQDWLRQNNNERPHSNILAPKQERYLAKWIYDALGAPKRYRYTYYELTLLKQVVQSADNSVGKRVFAKNLEFLEQWRTKHNNAIPHDTAYAGKLERKLARWVHRVLFNEIPYYYTEEQVLRLKDSLRSRLNKRVAS